MFHVKHFMRSFDKLRTNRSIVLFILFVLRLYYLAIDSDKINPNNLAKIS